MALRRVFGLTLAVFPVIGIAACTTAKPDVSTSLAPSSVAPSLTEAPIVTEDTSVSQPGTATYRCTDGGTMTIQNLGTSLHVLGQDGVSEDLPSAPSDQRSRYGVDHDAIVIDGREALVMKGGATPLTCKR